MRVKFLAQQHHAVPPRLDGRGSAIALTTRYVILLLQNNIKVPIFFDIVLENFLLKVTVGIQTY